MSGVQKYTKEELIGYYVLLKRKLGHQPSRGEWDNDKTVPSSKPVRDLFGSWGNFVEICGDGPIHCFVKDGKKKCNVCGEVKAVEEFYKKGDYPMPCCKECWKVKVEVMERSSNPEEKYSKTRQRWSINRIWEHKYNGIKQRALGAYGKTFNATGKGLLTEQEWQDWCRETVDIFLPMWGEWFKSGFRRDLTPSVDRIDNDGGYTKDNIQWLTMDDNIKKYHREEAEKRGRIVAVKDGDIIGYFKNQKEATEKLGLPKNKISCVLNGLRKSTGGYSFYYEK